MVALFVFDVEASTTYTFVVPPAFQAVIRLGVCPFWVSEPSIGWVWPGWSRESEPGLSRLMAKLPGVLFVTCWLSAKIAFFAPAIAVICVLVPGSVKGLLRVYWLVPFELLL